MLTFLRKIRKSLIETGSARRYVLYAIGEILLVMIGILLAVQVNIWNTNRHNHKLETQILRQIHTEFQQNKLQFERVSGFRLSNMEHCNKIIEALPIKVEEVDLDSIAYHLFHVAFRGTFTPIEGGINVLNASSSFDIISDDKLRDILIQWKGIAADYIEDESIADYHLVNFWDPYINSRFFERTDPDYDIKSFYDERVDPSFLESIEFHNLIKRRRNNLRRMTTSSVLEKSDLERVSEAIDTIILLTKVY